METYHIISDFSYFISLYFPLRDNFKYILYVYDSSPIDWFAVLSNSTYSKVDFYFPFPSTSFSFWLPPFFFFFLLIIAYLICSQKSGSYIWLLPLPHHSVCHSLPMQSFTGSVQLVPKILLKSTHFSIFTATILVWTVINLRYAWILTISITGPFSLLPPFNYCLDLIAYAVGNSINFR